MEERQGSLLREKKALEEQLKAEQNKVKELRGQLVELGRKFEQACHESGTHFEEAERLKAALGERNDQYNQLQEKLRALLDQ